MISWVTRLLVRCFWRVLDIMNQRIVKVIPKRNQWMQVNIKPCEQCQNKQSQEKQIKSYGYPFMQIFSQFWLMLTTALTKSQLKLVAIGSSILCPGGEIMCDHVKHSSHYLPLEAIVITASIWEIREITTFLWLQWGWILVNADQLELGIIFSTLRTPTKYMKHIVPHTKLSAINA